MLIFSRRLNKEVNAEYKCDHEKMPQYIYVQIEGDSFWSLIAISQIIER